ncbi:hypothetical protein FRC14_006015 [Serendipita sp. 396]|nr:hypothetical protein FRC14_006015 [Serendipita sp. 396]KAG8796848.1 hypothetical protein FRC16_009458 [Serendipita sp. 398]KAG8820489.1 hypothetical protein FRC19_008811 [Serendipita sp. 401]KAG8849737.1 hypothetical protein FRB91_009656 [Serendipita sp. 411]KAG8865429.1 hypothetical protein FRC20_009863 [Serendipita sp. 405]
MSRLHAELDTIPWHCLRLVGARAPIDVKRDETSKRPASHLDCSCNLTTPELDEEDSYLGDSNALSGGFHGSSADRKLQSRVYCAILQALVRNFASSMTSSCLANVSQGDSPTPAYVTNMSRVKWPTVSLLTANCIPRVFELR